MKYICDHVSIDCENQRYNCEHRVPHKCGSHRGHCSLVDRVTVCVPKLEIILPESLFTFDEK